MEVQKLEASGKTAEQPGAGSPRARRLLRWGRSGSGRGGEGPADYDSPDPGEQGAEDRASSLRGVARTAGRIALWVFIGLVLVRGLGDVLSGAGEQSAAPQPAPAAAFPGDEARAFAAGFARVYVESPSAGALAPYLAQGLADRLGTRPARSRARVVQVSPAGERVVGSGRALITVACELAGPAHRVLYLAVPVARDPSGGLSVFGLPSVVAAPPAGQADPEQAQPVAGAEAAEIRRLAERFLTAYLPGAEAGDLAYRLAPGTAIAPVGGGLRLVEVTEVGQLGDAAATRRTVLVEARVRDAASRATYPLAYRLEVVRRDRWYVSGVQGALR
jgi:hypothetical protein